MPFSVNGLIGAAYSKRSRTPDFEPGQPSYDNANRTWVYVRASEPITVGTCTVSPTFAVTDAAGNYTADATFAAGEYGWVRKTTSPL